MSDGIPRQLQALERKLDAELDGVHEELETHAQRIARAEADIRFLRTLIGGRRRRQQRRSKKKPAS